MLVGSSQPDNRLKRLIAPSSSFLPGIREGRSDPALGPPGNCFLPTLGSGGGGAMAGGLSASAFWDSGWPAAISFLSVIKWSCGFLR